MTETLVPMADRRPIYLMSPALAWLTAFMVVPCLLILVLGFFRRGIYGGIEYTFTLENMALVFDPLYAGIFLKSAVIAGLAASIAVVIGYAAAYAIASMPARRQPILLFFAVLPFWSNYLVRTYAWIVLLNREGLIVALARYLGFEGELPSMLYTESAVVVGLVYNYLPFVILACYAPLSRLNTEIVEASRDLGAIMAGADQGRHLLSAQTYEVLRAYEHQDTVILEVDWTGTLAVPLGPLSQGEVMKAHFAVFLDFVGDRIHRQRNYDCFEAW